jgi:hypothetical protein
VDRFPGRARISLSAQLAPSIPSQAYPDAAGEPCQTAETVK